MKTKRLIAALTALVLCLYIFIGCSQTSNTGPAGSSTPAPKAEAPAPAQTAESTPTDPKKPVDLFVLYQNDDFCNPEKFGLKMLEDFQKDNYPLNITYESKASPQAVKEAFMIKMAANERIDLFQCNDPLEIKNNGRLGTLQFIEDIAAKKGVSLDEGFGGIKLLASYDDKWCALPYNRNIWFMFYNKDIFDAAGVPYPASDKPMTWEEYRELAKKVTSGSGQNKIYGAFEFPRAQTFYSIANQTWKGADKFYGPDGLSFVNDPAYAESLQFFYDMMYVDGSLIPYTDILANNYDWDMFMSGKFAMDFDGGYSLAQLIKNKSKYPRDFKMGIAPLPVIPGTEGLISWGGVHGFAIPRTSKEVDVAFDIMHYVATKLPEYTQGYIPTYQKTDVLKLAGKLAEGLENDGITEQDIANVFLNPNTTVVLEKFLGPASSEYMDILKSEQEKFFIQKQSLEETVKNVKELADKAIKASQ